MKDTADIKIEVVTADGATREYALKQPNVLLGRSREADIRLPDSAVSRKHARIVRRAQDYILEDLGSTNGTFLEGRRIHTRRLREGDEFLVGHTRLRFSLLDHAKKKRPRANTLERLYARPREEATAQLPNEPAEAPEQVQSAFVEIIRGAGQGETRSLNENFFTLSDPKGEMLVIARRSTGHWLLRLGSGTIPMLNGRPLDAGGAQLHDGDFIEFGGYCLKIIVPSEQSH